MAASVHLEPVAERIRKDILASGLCIHCDETPWPIQLKEQDDGYMWIIANRAGSYYSFEPTRSGKVVAKTLEGYQGPALADGYVGYNRLKAMEGVTLANCWAHARRKFTDIAENYPPETAEIIDRLFKVERKAKSFAELEILRREESAATLYTIIESCKKVELDPRTYINMALRLSTKGIEVPTPLEHAKIIRT